MIDAGAGEREEREREREREDGGESRFSRFV